MNTEPPPRGLAATLRRETDHVWRSIHDHAFVRGLGDGSLPREVFAAYLAEDYNYLVEYARAMALGAGIVADLEGQRFFTEQAYLTLTVEMDLHRGVADAYGLTEADLIAFEPHPIARDYGAHLVETARRGPEGDLVAALLPCAAGYVEIADRLKARGLPGVPAYRSWIETYTSEGMRALAAWLEARLDRAASSADEATRARWLRLYCRSVEFELAFCGTLIARA